MPTTDLQRALDALANSITAAINSSLPPPVPVVMTYTGYPTSTKIVEGLQQNPGSAHITIWPMKSRSTRRYPPQLQVLVAASAGTSVTLSSNNTVATFGGVPKAGDVVHAFFGNPQSDGSYLVQTGDSLAVIATAVAAAINSIQVGGATASGDAVTLNGGLYFHQINIGGTGTLYAEVGRNRRVVQATLWMQPQPPPNDGTNQQEFDAIAQAILANVGTAQQTFLTDAIGMSVFCACVSDANWDADAQLSYSLFKWTILFEIEYAITWQSPYTQVEGIELQEQLGNQTSTTYIGG